MTLTVLDANVIIAAGNHTDSFHDAALAHLRAAVRRGDLGMAELTLAEVLVEPYRSGTVEERNGFLDAIGVKPLALGAGSFRRLARLRAETGLKMPDAVVLHTTLSEDAELVTFDRRLAAEARGRGVTVHDT